MSDANGSSGAAARKRAKHDLRTTDDDTTGRTIGTCRVCRRVGVYALAPCAGPQSAASGEAEGARDAAPPAAAFRDVAQGPPDTTTPFVDEIGHAIIQLRLLEGQAGAPITYELPDGRVRRVGDLLMELGDYVYKHEQPGPRILSPGMWRPK